MPEIDDWVLRAAGTQLKAWLDEGVGPVCVTVNLSKRQFESQSLVPRLDLILKETGLPPECLDIEITEAIAMDDTERQRSDAWTSLPCWVSMSRSTTSAWDIRRSIF